MAAPLAAGDVDTYIAVAFQRLLPNFTAAVKEAIAGGQGVPALLAPAAGDAAATTAPAAQRARQPRRSQGPPARAPTTDAIRLDKLQRQLEELLKQMAALQAENTRLTQELVAAHTGLPPAHAPPVAVRPVVAADGPAPLRAAAAVAAHAQPAQTTWQIAGRSGRAPRRARPQECIWRAIGEGPRKHHRLEHAPQCSCSGGLPAHPEAQHPLEWLRNRAATEVQREQAHLAAWPPRQGPRPGTYAAAAAREPNVLSRPPPPPPPAAHRGGPRGTIPVFLCGLAPAAIQRGCERHTRSVGCQANTAQQARVRVEGGGP